MLVNMSVVGLGELCAIVYIQLHVHKKIGSYTS